MKTLKQIAPIWAQRIKSGEWVDYKEELYHRASQCIVGEAWRYSDEYQTICKKCDLYAIRFGLHSPDTDSFKAVVRSFEIHFNKEHAKNHNDQGRT